jgi:hypothetical protein
MRSAALLLLLLPAGCERSMMGENQGVTANQIERLSTPRKQEDPRISVRLQPLAPADVERAGLLGAGCNFGRDGAMLLAAARGEAIVRVAGRLRRLVASAPVGRTGGFFEDPQLSVSVGRTSVDRAAPGETGSWPARITVTSGRPEIQLELRGVWTCGG